ncbi:hypothetical protein ACFXKG_23790 [Streptomyces sp. NPDC059255]|uniref:hypothetical protein n=1 Tax=Streptomyces sp. NPDC059255 TaxID=3346793 RepID=UPI0036C37AED
MIKDPLTEWDGPFPYDELTVAGVTPDTTHAAMADVSFDLMTRRLMNARTQNAWHELRDLRRRLLADVLLYDIDPAEEVARARAELVAERVAAGGGGEPPEVARALSVPVEWLNALATELSAVEVPVPEAAGPAPGLGVFPSGALIDSLIRFDR